MKDRLHKASLQVQGFEFSSGRHLLERLHTNDARRYPLDGGVRLSVFTNQGTLHVQTAPGFVFDGRSGPKIVDWYVPNLGSLEEIVCWLVHDLNGYGLDLCFKDTNVLLFAMLRDMAKYRYVKAKLVQGAVSVSDSWFGVPKPDDWCFRNIGLVETRFVA